MTSWVHGGLETDEHAGDNLPTGEDSKGAFRVDVPVGQESKSAVVNGVGYDAAIAWAKFGTIT